jgi:hypothetical protein
VNVERIDDTVFKRELEAASKDVSWGRQRRGADVILYGANAVADLARLSALKGYLQDAGMIWVVWRKGKAARALGAPSEDDIRRVALEIGLVDVKVMAFSEILSGLKLVIPVKERPKR